MDYWQFPQSQLWPLFYAIFHNCQSQPINMWIIIKVSNIEDVGVFSFILFFRYFWHTTHLGICPCTLWVSSWQEDVTLWYQNVISPRVLCDVTNWCHSDISNLSNSDISCDISVTSLWHQIVDWDIINQRKILAGKILAGVRNVLTDILIHFKSWQLYLISNWSPSSSVVEHSAGNQQFLYQKKPFCELTRVLVGNGTWSHQLTIWCFSIECTGFTNERRD